MAQNLFKTRYIPNGDGSDSSTALTNGNCAFVNTYLGDDNTGDGTRQKPYRSMAKALLKGRSCILFRGVINEAFTMSAGVLIGDDINQIVLTANYSVSFYQIVNLTTDCLYTPNVWKPCFRIISTGVINKVITANYPDNISNYLIKQFKGAFYASRNSNYYNTSWDYITTNHFYGVTSYPGSWTLNNSIVIRTVSIQNAYTQMKYTVMSSCSRFAYSEVNIVIPNWTSDSKANMILLRNAFIASGMTSANALTVFPQDGFGNELNMVISESRYGGSRPNIFNKYSATLTGTITAAISAASTKSSITLTVSDSSLWPTTGDLFLPFTGSYTANGITITGGNEVFSYTSITINSATSITLTGSYTFKMAYAIGTIGTVYGDVIDYSLNPIETNEALWASSIGGYVGMMRPAYDSIQSNMTPIVLVDESTGDDTATAGDLIYMNSAGEFVFNSTSTQTWNRFRDSVTKYIPLGSTFKGGGGDSTDGSPFGYYIGKKQNLIGTTKYYAGDTLTVGKWYKVFNDTAISVSNAIVYNSVHYLPEYTFCCVTGVTAFSLLNAGTGSYVMEILAGVIESIELMPVDMIAILTATLSGLVSTIPVASTSGFPSSGSLYIGGKTFVYTSIDATNFYGLSQDVGTVASGKDIGLISAFPKFSVPINGECKLLYYTEAGATRYGKTAGNPVLFADLAVANMVSDFGSISNKISYYDSWAISNADQEFFVLGDPSLTSPRSTYFITAIPNIRYYRRSINAHFDKPYDY